MTNQILEIRNAKEYKQVLKRSRRDIIEGPQSLRITGGMIVGFITGLAFGQASYFLFAVYKLARELNVDMALVLSTVKEVISKHFHNLLTRMNLVESHNSH